MESQSPCNKCPDDTTICRGNCLLPGEWVDKSHDFSVIDRENPRFSLVPMARTVKHPTRPEDLKDRRPVFNMNMESRTNLPYYHLLYDEALRQGVSIQNVVMQCLYKVILLADPDADIPAPNKSKPMDKKKPKRAVFNMNMEGKPSLLYYEILREEAWRQRVTIQKIVMQCIVKIIHVGVQA